MNKNGETAVGATKRGRPVEIDEASAAFEAALVFWKHGYEGASIDDLVESSGVSRPGLYRTFGGKEPLFLTALETYEKRITGDAIDAFEAEVDIVAAVTAFLAVSARNNTETSFPSGCLMACCAPASAELIPSVRSKLAKSFVLLEERLMARFALEMKKGVLTVSRSPKTRADMLLDFMTAQAVRARSGETRQALLSAIPQKCAAVLMADTTPKSNLSA